MSPWQQQFACVCGSSLLNLVGPDLPSPAGRLGQEGQRWTEASGDGQTGRLQLTLKSAGWSRGLGLQVDTGVGGAEGQVKQVETEVGGAGRLVPADRQAAGVTESAWKFIPPGLLIFHIKAHLTKEA